MQMLSDDDRSLAELSREELDAAWDLWFDLAQTINGADPASTHGVFVGIELRGSDPHESLPPGDRPRSPGRRA